MKAIINNIEFEGTPAEFAELIMLLTPTIECSENLQEIESVVNNTRKEPNQFIDNEYKINVSYQGTYIGIMNQTEFAALMNTRPVTIYDWFKKTSTVEKNGYTATIISKGYHRKNITLKVTDSKGDNRIYRSILDFCKKTKTSRGSFKRLRNKNPSGPWKLNNYIIEKI